MSHHTKNSPKNESGWEAMDYHYIVGKVDLNLLFSKTIKDLTTTGNL